MVVSRSGTLGLFITLALRELTPAGTITVIAEYARQAALATAFGASDVLSPQDAYRGIRRSTGAFQLISDRGRPFLDQPFLDQPFLLGGADVAVDAVGSPGSTNTVLRSTRPGGRVVLAGVPGGRVDLSPVWFRELELAGSYASPSAGEDGTPLFDLAVGLASRTDLSTVVGARYGLRRWRQALDHAQTAGKPGTVKVAFDLTGER